LLRDCRHALRARNHAKRFGNLAGVAIRKHSIEIVMPHHQEF
jgi:hypothetical protein